MRNVFAILAVLVATICVARAEPSCGDPPRVDDQMLKGDLEGKAKLLSSMIGDANLKGQIETSRSDIFSKYPNAGAARSDAYLQYMFCSFVLTDAKLSAQEKFQAIQEFRQTADQPVKGNGPRASTRGDQSPAVINKGDTNIGYGAAPAPAPRRTGAERSPSAGEVRTEGNQSPAVNSGGNVGIQYGAPPSSASAR